MVRGFALTAFTAVLFLTSCANKGSAPHASVLMRDGTTVTGNVLASSATEIKLAGDDNVTRTIPMSQVRAVDYGEAPAAGAAPAAPAGSSAPAAPPSEPPHEGHYHPPESAITTRTYLLPVGTAISVRNEETIDSAKAARGQTFAAEVTRDVLDEDRNVVIPRGSNAAIVIRSASKGGQFQGSSDLVMDLDTISIDGRRYQLSTVDLAQRGRQGVGVNRRTGEFAGGGAAVGAIIGAIAGGGKGAAIGAGSGAGAGVVTEIVTKGSSIKVPVESVLTFRLDRPLRIVAAQ